MINKTSKKEKIAQITTGLLFAISSIIFFGKYYPGHLHNLEQYQMFLYTGDYLFQNILIPGGISNYLAKFLTQFFYKPWLGAVIIGLLLLSVQYASYRCAKNRNGMTFAVSFIPALACWASLMREDTLLCFPVSILLSLIAICVFQKVRNRWVFYLSAPAIYFIVGPIGIIFILSQCTSRKPLDTIIATAIFICGPILAQYIYPYALKVMIMGIFYWSYKFYPNTAILICSAVICLSVIALCSKYICLKKFKVAIPICTALIIVSAGAVILKKMYQTRAEQEFVYDYLVSREDWDGIIDKSKKEKSLGILSDSAIALALGKKGILADEIFKYEIMCPQSIIPDIVKHHFLSIFTAELYYQLGIINGAISTYFDSQEAIRAEEKSPRITKRLAECHSILGNKAIAQRYLNQLEHTLFYSKWAKNFNPDAKEYKHLKRINERLNDFSFSRIGCLKSWERIYFLTGDRLVYDYAIVFSLIVKNTKTFYKLIKISPYTVMPKYCQQALLLIFIGDNISNISAPEFIDKNEVTRYVDFMTDKAKGTKASKMHRKYGDTFWFYFFYVKL